MALFIDSDRETRSVLRSKSGIYGRGMILVRGTGTRTRDEPTYTIERQYSSTSILRQEERRSQDKRRETTVRWQTETGTKELRNRRTRKTYKEGHCRTEGQKST